MDPVAHNEHQRTRRRDPAAAANSFRRIGRLCSWLAVPFLRIDGPSDDRATPDPIIWAPNHRSMFDTFLGLIVLYRMGRTAAFFVTERYFASPIIGRLLLRAGAIPVDPDDPRALLADGARCIDAGISLVIMAEGRLVAPDERVGGIGPLQPGVAVLAKRLGVAIQPVAMIGSDDVWPIGRRTPRVPLLRRQRLLVRFGEPIAATGRSRDLLASVQAALARLVTSAEHQAQQPTRTPEQQLLHRPAAVDGHGLAGHVGRRVAR